MLNGFYEVGELETSALIRSDVRNFWTLTSTSIPVLLLLPLPGLFAIFAAFILVLLPPPLLIPFQTICIFLVASSVFIAFVPDSSGPVSYPPFVLAPPQSLPISRSAVTPASS